MTYVVYDAATGERKTDPAPIARALAQGSELGGPDKGFIVGLADRPFVRAGDNQRGLWIGK